jgi:tetratricopeptide (TPR) repeat protein
MRRWTDCEVLNDAKAESVKRSIARVVMRRAAAAGVLACAALAFPPSIRAHGSFHDRIERANRDIESHPLDPEPYLERARILRAHGDFAESLADIDRAEALAPTLADVPYDRGRTLLEAGRYAEADIALGRFLEGAPEHPDAHAARAHARLQLGRPLEAARDLDAAVEFQPVALPERYLDRAEAFAQAGDEHLAEAIEGLDAGLARLGAVLALERAAIELEVRRGAFDAAIARIDRVAAHSARKEAWFDRRGDIELQAGRDADAQRSYQRALAEIERLPPQRRRTPLTQRLEAKLRSEVDRLSETVPE